MSINKHTTPESAMPSAKCSPGWWLAGWQRRWRGVTLDEAHELKIWRRLRAAEGRYRFNTPDAERVATP